MCLSFHIDYRFLPLIWLRFSYWPSYTTELDEDDDVELNQRSN